jgi:site-specific recombinase XerD
MIKKNSRKAAPLLHTEPASAPDTLPTAVKETLHAYRFNLEALGRSPNTLKSYWDILECYFSFLKNEDLLGPFNEIGRNELNAYLFHLKKCQRWPKRPPGRRNTGNLSLFTIQDHVRTIKVFWTWLFREGYIDKNPLEKFPLPSVPKIVLKVITPELFEKILGLIDRTTPSGVRYYCIMLLLYDTGLRIGELVNIIIENIDFILGSIKVLGKRNKEREIPVSRLTLREIQRYIRDFRPKICRVESPYLFSRPDSNHVTANSIQQFMKRLSKKLEINGLKLHPHLFRHSFGTQFIINGGNTFFLKEIMGHESLLTTLKYTHLQPKDLCTEHTRFSPVANLKMVKKSNITNIRINEKRNIDHV